MNLKRAYIFILSALILFTGACYAKDLHQYLRDTRQLVDNGEYELALERTIWFHNHALEHDPGMLGVRLSFALSDWYKLANAYPPALVALNNAREANAELIMSGESDFSTFSEYVSMNRVFNEENESINLFKQIEITHPSAAQDYWRLIKDIAIQRNEYGLLRKYIGNVYREYKTEEERFIALMESDMVEFSEYREALIASYENMFVEDVVDLINISVALDDKESAQIIRESARKLVKDYRLDDIVIN